MCTYVYIHNCIVYKYCISRPRCCCSFLLPHVCPNPQALAPQPHHHHLTTPPNPSFSKALPRRRSAARGIERAGANQACPAKAAHMFLL